MIGRLFRRAEGKTHAEVYQILPAAVPNSKRFKDQRNAILTVVFSAMLLEDVFLPISLSTKPTKTKKDRTDRLMEIVTDTETWQALSRDFLVAANGRDYHQAKKYDAAIATFSEAISVDPKMDDALLFRGMAYLFYKEDYARAIADLTECLKRTPENQDVGNAGMCRYLRGLA